MTKGCAFCAIIAEMPLVIALVCASAAVACIDHTRKKKEERLGWEKRREEIKIDNILLVPLMASCS